MGIALTIRSVERGSRRKREIAYEPAFTGNYVPGGDVVDITLATNPAFKERSFPGADLPERIYMTGEAGGLSFVVVPGATNKLHVLKVLESPGLFEFALAGAKGATVPAGTEENADQAAGPTNAALIAAAANFTTMAGVVTVAVQPDAARNAIIVAQNTTGGALNLFQGITTFTVTGLFRGVAQTELITITSSAGNKAVAAAKFRYKAGVKPFDSITSITYDNAGDGTLSVSVAPGALIGLPVNSENSVDADFTKFDVNAANRVVATNIDHANKTANIGSVADGVNVAITYRKGAEMAARAYPASLTGDQANLRLIAIFRGM